MSKREYPHYVGREKYRGRPKLCECCDAPATHAIMIQLSIFRGDDEGYLVCEEHATLARMNYAEFVQAEKMRREFLSEEVQAQHEETGRLWSGQRRQLPPHYFVIPVSEEG